MGGMMTGLLWEESERDWPEDYAFENGHYLNCCMLCGKMFSGHKRRVVCKKCHVESQSE